MALDTYQNLQSAVLTWLNRTGDPDATAAVPDWITLAEAEMRRQLRRTTKRATITIAGVTTTPPSDLAELVEANLVSSSPEFDNPIRVVSPGMLAERSARSAGVAGRPTDMAFVGGQILVAPTPDQVYSASIVYAVQLTPLATAAGGTNAILQEAPDAYLYGALVQSAPYLEHDERLPVWQTKFDNAIAQLNTMRTKEEYGATPTAIRLPIIFSGT